MSELKHNLVQAEFFYANIRADTEEDFTADLAHRLEIGRPIKSAIRFFDEMGNITSFVGRYKASHAREEDQLTITYGSGARATSAMNRLVKGLGARSRMRREEALPLVLTELERIVTQSCPLATEMPDRSYRMAVEDEPASILAAARRATAVWIFVAAPTELTADSISITGSVTLV